MEYTRILTDEEVKILEHDLLDIKDWIDKAIDGKINNCGKRAARQYDEVAKADDLDTVPTKDHLKRAALFAHPNYKNRLQRETEANETRENKTITEPQP
jgi:hypothetical protein